jgi:2-polyprenyl-3-methyl-5-hydroxy-6-metoxy-1,4-benzoquinol methylase
MSTCPLCGSDDVEVRYDLTVAQSAEDIPGLIARCCRCPMWFKILTGSGAIPTDYPGESGDDPIAATYLYSTTARAQFRDMLAGIGGAQRPGRRLLDIGAAQGVLLEEAERLGFSAEGIDHSPSNVEAARARGLRMHLGEAESLTVAAPFDVVTLIDFIEHVRDPLGVLRRAHAALVPGGTLVVYTPNHRSAVVGLAVLLERLGAGYAVREIFGRNHLCFFDDRSLPLALQRGGFTVQRQRQFAYDPRRPGQYISPLNLAAVTAVDRLGRPFGRAFRLLVYAHKAPA